MDALEQPGSLISYWITCSKALPRGTQGLCILIVGNLAGILLANVVPKFGWLPLPLRDMLLMGIGFGELIFVFLLMGFGHFRAPGRQLLCSLGIFLGVGVWQVAWGAQTDIIALSQLFSLGGLWVSYALLISFRILFRLEFGIPIKGVFLSPRNAQFGLYSFLILVGILAIAFAFVRLLIVFSGVLASSRQISIAEFLAPFGFLLGILLFALPVLLTSLGSRISRIWVVTAAAWGGVPVIFAASTMPLDGVALFASFWLTVMVNLIGLRLIGFRWLPVAQGQQSTPV